MTWCVSICLRPSGLCNHYARPVREFGVQFDAGRVKVVQAVWPVRRGCKTARLLSLKKDGCNLGSECKSLKSALPWYPFLSGASLALGVRSSAPTDHLHAAPALAVVGSSVRLLNQGHCGDVRSEPPSQTNLGAYVIHPLFKHWVDGWTKHTIHKLQRRLNHQVRGPYFDTS